MFKSISITINILRIKKENSSQTSLKKKTKIYNNKTRFRKKITLNNIHNFVAESLKESHILVIG